MVAPTFLRVQLLGDIAYGGDVTREDSTLKVIARDGGV